MRKTRPKITITENDRLRTIANSANVRADEMINALIFHAYQMPHAQWDEIIQTYRKSQRPN